MHPHKVCWEEKFTLYETWQQSGRVVSSFRLRWNAGVVGVYRRYP